MVLSQIKTKNTTILKETRFTQLASQNERTLVTRAKFGQIYDVQSFRLTPSLLTFKKIDITCEYGT